MVEAGDCRSTTPPTLVQPDEPLSDVSNHKKFPILTRICTTVPHVEAQSSAAVTDAVPVAGVPDM